MFFHKYNHKWRDKSQNNTTLNSYIQTVWCKAFINSPSQPHSGLLNTWNCLYSCWTLGLLVAAVADFKVWGKPRRGAGPWLGLSVWPHLRAQPGPGGPLRGGQGATPAALHRAIQSAEVCSLLDGLPQHPCPATRNALWVHPSILVGVRISQCKRVHRTVSPSILVGVCISQCKQVHHTVSPFILVGVCISQCKRVHHTVSPHLSVQMSTPHCESIHPSWCLHQCKWVHHTVSPFILVDVCISVNEYTTLCVYSS